MQLGMTMMPATERNLIQKLLPSIGSTPQAVMGAAGMGPYLQALR
jgi:hypothetical protein